MTNYTFAELLTVFFHLHQDVLQRKTQGELVTELGVSRRTLTGWFAGDYLPRERQVILKLATALSLTAFQTDLLLYAVEPTWVQYGTPAAVLQAAQVVRYREDATPPPNRQSGPTPSIAQIEQTWRLHFHEQFESNYQRWGEGEKRNGMARLTRTIQDGRYVLDLHNHYHEDVFLGGDSNCFAPPIYYMTVWAQMVEGVTDADGYGLFFEEINDECYAFLRIRDRQRRFSVVQTHNGGDNAKVYIRQALAPALRPGERNRLAILALHAEHWFYINDGLVGAYQLPRLPRARLDVAIAAGPQQRVICYFDDFHVYTPPE